MKIRRGSWNEELFRVLEGFPELAHDDEVDAGSGALEMLNQQLKNAGYYEWLRLKAEEYTKSQGGEFELPPKTVLAPGSVEWEAEQEEKRRAQTRLLP